jgi:hypothetical protein
MSLLCLSQLECLVNIVLGYIGQRTSKTSQNILEEHIKQYSVSAVRHNTKSYLAEHNN